MAKWAPERRYERELNEIWKFGHIFRLEKDAMEIWKKIFSAAKQGRLGGAALIRAREFFYRLTLGQIHFYRRNLPRISIRGEFSVLPMATILTQSLDRAFANLPDFVREMDGMSGQKYRSFINNLVRSHPDARYLEIGSWQGSTAAAALFSNSVKALCIDNWSQFGGAKSAFVRNMDRVLSQSPNVHFGFIENDFRCVDYNSLGRFNIFLFDGPHEEQDQYDGIMVAQPALEKSFILIVDDWNWVQVRVGTFRAIRDSRYSISSSIEIRTTLDNSTPQVSGKNSDWHNGYFIAALVGV